MTLISVISMLQITANPAEHILVNESTLFLQEWKFSDWYLALPPVILSSLAAHAIRTI
jgi:hypothetical protein